MMNRKWFRCIAVPRGRTVREDILTFDNVHELRAISLLVELLRERVASPLSYQSLSEDLGIAPNTVKRYVEILEALYIVFRVT